MTSHEIRGPLTAIITGMDTIRRRGDKLGPERKERLMEMITQQGEHLARLVDDLLITSQLQAEKLTLQLVWVDLDKVIGQAVEGANAKRADHQLQLFIDPIRCRVDASRVGQIVRNLVENAYKYTPPRARVSVTATTTERGINIQVSDTGEGIPPDKRDELFDAFSRIDETAAGQDGVGLGLYIVSQLVARMGGRVDLVSSSKGTTFTILIPCETEAQAPRLGLVTDLKESGTA